MKRILHLDQNYQQLRLLHFFNSGIPQFFYENVRKYTETILIGNMSKIKDLMKILRKQNSCTIQSLKNLMFYNAVIYETLKKPSQNLENVVSEQINNIVALENTRFHQILQSSNRKSKSKGFSIDKATNWMRQTFSRSKDNKQVKLNRAMSQIEKNSKNKSIQSSQKVTASTKNLSVKYTQVKNKQQLLIPKIILPYAAYLLKLNSCQINFKHQILFPTMQTQQIWKIINLMKYLMKITNSFILLMRYYSEYYQVTINTILKVIDFELKNLYPSIKTFIGMKLKQIKKQILDVYGKCHNKKQQINMLQKIIHQYQMNQIKRIIEEVLIINDQITWVYRGKYTFYMIKSMKIPPLTILTQNDQHYDLLFDVLQSVSKNKSQDKKQNIQKQKQKNKQIAQESKRKSSQIKQPIYPEGSKKFAQKKLKIVTESNKTTSMTAIIIIKPNSQQFTSNVAAVPEKQESAFRKMRLNTTKQNIHLEQSKKSNTRRLRL